METPNQEIKKDIGKNMLALIPPEAILAIGKVLTFGCEKYSADSWREGMNYSRVYSAIQRHLNAFWGEGSDTDEESGLSHLSHAFCGLAFLLAYEANKECYRTFDDRAGSHNEFYKNREKTINDLVYLVQEDNAGLFNGKLGDDSLEIMYNTLLDASRTLLYIDDPPFGFPDLTKMPHSEAYKHLEVGMRVKVLRKANADESDWRVKWVDPMDKYIGGVFLIERLHEPVGVVLRYERGGGIWNFPASVLKIISRPEPEETPIFHDLTKMNHFEACKHLKVGMRVKVLRRAGYEEKDWNNCWVGEMDNAINTILTIEEFTDYGILMKEVGSSFPAFILEIISEGE